MAKRRRLRKSKSNPQGSRPAPCTDDACSGAKHWQASVILHPSPVPVHPTKRRVHRAHEKHTLDAAGFPSRVSTHPLTLGDRFHALPPELRAHIFAFLLVQPVKWRMTHRLSCPLAASPGLDIRPERSWPAVCADCSRCAADDHRYTLTRPVWVSPWRSAWAPPQTNPFICTACYDGHWRPGPFPRRAAAQPCLCATRRNLQTLLVCRQWYGEAGTVLYSANTFAFEEPEMLIAFVDGLPPRWRSIVSKVSLLVKPEGGEIARSVFEGGKVWAALRSLEGLSRLELDARFLTNDHAVRGMVRMGLRNVRRVRFVQRKLHDPVTAGAEQVPIWPLWQEGTLLKGGFAEEVARVVRGEKRRWTKKPSSIEEMVRVAGAEMVV